MNITSLPFGNTENGEAAELFILTNDKGASVKITNYGGIITEIVVPDKNGELENVILGFDNIESYYSDAYKKTMPYFGAIIGRYANRINNGKFSIGGTNYQVPQNLGAVALHGGFVGFDKKLWKAKTTSSDEELCLILNYLSPHMEEGFPGNLAVEVKYKWNNINELMIDYSAKTDKATHLNLTNHAYFNLSAFKKDVLDHEVRIYADYFTEVDENSIPTGKLSSIEGSCMDLRETHTIGERIEEVEGSGYDHNYVINGYDKSLRISSEATDPESGRKLEVLTTEPGVQFYTANHLDGSLTRGEISFGKRSGFCLETQHFPDTPNKSSFPSTLLRPGQKFQSRTIYKFSRV